MTLPPVMIAACTLSGLILGSFAVTAGLRMARREQVWAGRSHCDACGAALRFADTAPLVSFALAQGRCRHCGAAIDPIHIAGEAGGAAILVAAAATASSFAHAATLGLLGLTLLTAAVVDSRSRRLPDALTAAVAVLACAASLLLGHLVIGLIWGVLTFVVLETVRRVFAARTGKVGLGFGDVKLISALAIWLGPETPLVVASAAAAGLLAFKLLRPADQRLPFGPFIAATGFAVGLAAETAWFDSWRGLP